MECAQTGQALENTRWRELNWDTVVGRVKLQARPGHALEQEQWICPARVAWGLKPCERKTPELQARLTYTATAVGSYAEAEKMATTWGTPVSDGGLHHQVQKLGQKAPALKLPTPVAAQGEPLLPRSSRASARSKNGKSGSPPMGSGAVESLGQQFQGRLRGCGQFWSRPGLTCLLRLTVLVKNDDHSILWN